MKATCNIIAAAVAAACAGAPLPYEWRVDWPSARVETIPVRHGEDVEFRPAWHVGGRLADTNGWTFSLAVQTNGAAPGEWADIPGRVFSHTNDCGATAYNVLVRAADAEGAVNYSAAARLRMLDSPGFSPGALPPPATFSEADPVFSAWLSTFHFPETSLEPATNYTDAVASGLSNNLAVVLSGKRDLSDRSYVRLVTNDYWDVRGGESVRLYRRQISGGAPTWTSTNGVWELAYAGCWIFGNDPWNPVFMYEPEGAVDLSCTIGGTDYALTRVSIETNTLALVSQIPSAPGEYATVSNRAMSALQEHQSLQPATNYTDSALGRFAATGTVSRASSYGTPTRWTDATGCVWEVTTSWRIYTNGIVAAGWTAWDYEIDTSHDGAYYALCVGPIVDIGSYAFAVAEQMFQRVTLPEWQKEYEAVFDWDYDLYGLTQGDTIRAARDETNLVGRVALTNDIPSTNALPDTVARAVYDVHDLKWDEEESILYWCRMVGGHDLCIAVTNVDLTHPTNSAALKAWREANR